jgi:dTMP kinase
MSEYELLSRFIVLEGIDGSGTSTQLERVKQALQQKNYSVFTSCEPTTAPIGLLIRRILHREIEAEAETTALLFAADRNDHVFNRSHGIIAKLAEYDFVISDRYFFSSLAYQSVQCGFPFVFSLNSRFPLPEFCFYLKIPVDTGRTRRLERKKDELFDDTLFQKKVVRAYENAFTTFADSPMKFHTMDGQRDRAEITADMVEIITQGN